MTGSIVRSAIGTLLTTVLFLPAEALASGGQKGTPRTGAHGGVHSGGRRFDGHQRFHNYRHDHFRRFRHPGFDHFGVHPGRHVWAPGRWYWTGWSWAWIPGHWR